MPELHKTTLKPHEYTLRMPELHLFSVRNACAERAPCLSGCRTMLAWPDHNACAARSDGLSGCGIVLPAAFPAAIFFYFICKHFATRLRYSKISSFRSENFRRLPFRPQIRDSRGLRRAKCQNDSSCCTCAGWAGLAPRGYVVFFRFLYSCGVCPTIRLNRRVKCCGYWKPSS